MLMWVTCTITWGHTDVRSPSVLLLEAMLVSIFWASLDTMLVSLAHGALEAMLMSVVHAATRSPTEVLGVC